MALAAVCFAGFLAMVLAQVSYRYLGISMVFSEDAARLFNIYAVFLGLVFVVHADGDVRIDLVDRLVGQDGPARRLLSLLYLILMICFLAALATGAFLLVRSNWGLTLPAIPFLHQGHIYLAPLAGAVLSIAVCVSKLAATLAGLIGSRGVAGHD